MPNFNKLEVNKLEISVIMPVFNETNIELNESIESILSQTYTNFELIIIDDNPQSARIKLFLKNKYDVNKKIRVIYNHQNIGPSLSTNKGVKLAHGKFIAKMDADDICVKNRLSSQLKFINNNNLDLICSNFYGFNKNLTSQNNGSYYGKLSVTNQHIIKLILSHFNIAMGPTLFFKRDSFIKIHGYRDILAEDYDLITRFITHEYKVGYQSSSLIYKRNRKNNLSNNNSLSEFIVTYLISKYIKKNGYNSILPINNINEYINKISKYDINIFNDFKINLNKFKRKKSLLYLLKASFYTFLSGIVLKRNMWMLSAKIYYKKFNNKDDKSVSS